MIMITKASDDEYLSFRKELNIEELVEKYGEIIVKENFFYEEDELEIMSTLYVGEVVAKKVSKSKYEVMIYDDYVE